MIVFADWPGRSPQEVEDQVTYPLSVNLQGLAGVKTVRATSMFGFSFITVIFEDKIDNYFARTRVLERLNYLGDLLPGGRGARSSAPMPPAWAGSISTTCSGPAKAPRAAMTSRNCARCRTGSSATSSTPCRAWPRSAASAASCASTRSRSRPRMRALHGVTLGEVLDAVRQSNLNVGGKVIEENGVEFVVRGVGLVRVGRGPGEHRR